METVTSPEPFTLKLNLSVLQLLKVIFNSLWLFPLRIIFIILPSLIGGFTLTFIIGYGYRPRSPAIPVTGWRRWLKRHVFPLLARSLLFGMGYHWIKVKGHLCTTDEAPILVVSPHSTAIDSFIISCFTIPSVVTKAESRRIPIIGKAIEILQPIFVQRTEQNSRGNTVSEIQRRAASNGSWPHVLVYAEGTATNAKCVISYKRGAFAPGLPVQQVLFRHNNNNNVMIWADQGFGLLLGLFLTVCQFHNHLTVEFVPPYAPTAEEKSDSLLYAREAQKRAASHLGVPATLHCYEDLRLLRLAKQLGLPYSVGIVEFDWLKTETKFSYDRVRVLLERYSEMNRSRNGYLTSAEMAAYLRVESEPANQLHHMIQSTNRKGENGLQFRDYVWGLGVLATPLSSSEHFTSQLFKILDQSARGYITLADLQQSSLPWSPGALDNMDYDCFLQFLMDNLEYVLLANMTYNIC